MSKCHAAMLEPVENNCDGFTGSALDDSKGVITPNGVGYFRSASR
jgi:hypothetical protein